MTQEGPYKAQL